jgi:hypothetical protein
VAASFRKLRRLVSIVDLLRGGLPSYGALTLPPPARTTATVRATCRILIGERADGQRRLRCRWPCSAGRRRTHPARHLVAGRPGARELRQLAGMSRSVDELDLLAALRFRLGYQSASKT